MQKASFLTRLRFSYTFALLEVLACSLHGRLHRTVPLAQAPKPG